MVPSVLGHPTLEFSGKSKLPVHMGFQRGGRRPRPLLTALEDSLPGSSSPPMKCICRDSNPFEIFQGVIPAVPIDVVNHEVCCAFRLRDERVGNDAVSQEECLFAPPGETDVNIGVRGFGALKESARLMPEPTLGRDEVARVVAHGQPFLPAVAMMAASFRKEQQLSGCIRFGGGSHRH